MTVDVNYNNHNLIHHKYEEYSSIVIYKCSKCNKFICKYKNSLIYRELIFDLNEWKVKLFSLKDINELSCDELIIKRLLE